MKYSIGIDYGTQSARAELVNISKCSVEDVVEVFYPHGVMTEEIPTGRKLGSDWALQDGDDYYIMAVEAVRKLLSDTGVAPEDVIGIGVDTTACTMIPIGSDLEPLSSDERYRDRPNAYVKLWKHHAAQKYADMLNSIAEERGESFLRRYGGKISSEWTVPKVMQIVYEDPDLYDAAYSFCDIADWLNYKLTGNLTKNNVTAGFKSMHLENGYPSNDFFKALHPKMDGFVRDKLWGEILHIGGSVGLVSEEFSKASGLTTATAVAVSQTDAGVVPIALGMGKEGQMIMSIGTSTCHFLLGNTLKDVPGICGSIFDGAVPGFYAYEAGQAAVGDSFSWFIRNFVGEDLNREAEAAGKSIYALLAEKASAVRPGASGLVALDWFNGNRSTLVNVDLSGVIMGMKIDTKAEEVYRAILEGTAFGTRKIIDNFREHGVPVTELYACGGIPKKDPFMMQIYADVCNCRINVSGESLAAAYGSAVLGAVAAGSANGGFDTVAAAEEKLALTDFTVYEPVPGNVQAYEKLYRVYEKAYEFFGEREGLLMELAGIRKEYSKQ